MPDSGSGLTAEGNAELAACEKTVRAAVREFLPKIFYATHHSDKLIFEDAINAKVRLAVGYLRPYPAELCSISYRSELKQLYWELDHGVWRKSENPNGIKAGKKAAIGRTSADASCSLATKVKGIVAELAPDSYYADTKEKNEEESLRIYLRVSKLIHENNIGDEEKEACAGVLKAAFQNFVTAAERAKR